MLITLQVSSILMNEKMRINYLILESYLVIYTLDDFFPMVKESLQTARNILKDSYSGSTIDVHEDPEEDIITLFLDVQCAVNIKETLLKQEEFEMTWFLDKFCPNVLSIFSVSFNVKE